MSDHKHQFQKGVSGNPGGRPKGIERLVRELVAAQKDDRSIDGWSRLTLRLFKIAMGEEHGNVREQIAAAKLLYERAHGYPKQVMDITGSALDKSDVSKMSDEELLELAATDHTGPSQE